MRDLIFKKDALYKLSANYVPERLPRREEHQAEIFRTIISFLEEKMPIKAIVLNGPSGTGKTVTVKKSAEQILKYCKEKGIKIEYRHLNTRFASSDFTLAQMIALSLLPNMPSRGYSSRELLYAVFDYLEKSGNSFLLVLDDFDDFIGEVRSKFFTDLLKISEEYGDRVKLILVLIGIQDFSRWIKDSWLTHFMLRMRKSFTPYDAEEISMILKDRVELSFNTNVIDDPTIYLIGRMTERFGYGSARYALELLLMSGLNASYEGSQRIFAEHVREAQYRLESVISPTDLKAMFSQDPEMSKLLKKLLAAFESSEEPFLSLKLLEEYGIKIRESSVIERLKRLHLEGLLDYNQQQREVALIGMPLKLLQSVFD
ncbi:MAG: AAA family ATPase [Crenarchaeota archaeon]|nr:AAA family ATPase [Thermoproteota archaeon]MDW8034346.1 AAA family ATPase [Nitrososphaerota archaeon]